MLSVLEALGSILSTRGGKKKDLMKVGLHPAVEDEKPPKLGHRVLQSSEDAQGSGEEAGRNLILREATVTPQPQVLPSQWSWPPESRPFVS